MILLLLGACRSGPDLSTTLVAEGTWSPTERITLPVASVAPESPLCVDWSGLTRNARGDAYHPAPHDRLELVRWSAPLAEVVAEVVDGDDAEQVWFESGGRDGRTCVRDRTFGPAGTAWTVTLLGADLRDLLPVNGAAIGVDEDASATTVVLEDDGPAYTFDVALPEPIPAPAGVARLVYDWSPIPDGDRFDADEMDEVLVARFDAAPDELATVLDARLTGAVERYTVPVPQGPALAGIDTPDATSVDLEVAVDEDGAPFPGFTTDGTWIVAVACDLCWTVPPPILSVVEVVP